MRPKRVVVAPLDWGLGHATRCIPIINELVKRGCEVWIASSGRALSLLQKEFPVLKFFELTSYSAVYPRNTPLMISIFLQLPKFLLAINKEHKQLDECITQNKIDLVISDSRFGCWTSKVPCVFITHQLNIIMPVWLKGIQFFINGQNHRFIKRFTECWIPDVKGINNLTGKLTVNNSLPGKHVGILSRFQRNQASTPLSLTSTPFSQTYEIAVILSGPEPQRSVLEDILKPQLANKSKAILVKGVVERQQEWTLEKDLQIVNYLTSYELQQLIESSSIIIARSGYSTVMDLVALGKNGIFIPTPGQTEQEFLASRLKDAGVCFSMSQKDFDLNFALQQSKRFRGFSNIETSSDLLNKALDEVLA